MIMLPFPPPLPNHKHTHLSNMSKVVENEPYDPR